MAQNFDEQRIVVPEDQREFIISGQKFTLKRRVRPDVLRILGTLADDEGNVGAKIDTIDTAIEMIVKSSDLQRWRDLRASEQDDELVDFLDLQAILNWAIEVLTSRPLENALSSTDGSTAPAAPSQAVSSFPVAVPSTG